MDLHYTHVESRLRFTESKQVDVGKPLVASCKLYEAIQTTPPRKPDAASAHNIGRILHPKKTPAGPHQPFTRKAECGAQVAPFACNEPEENDENELQD